jgi:hypothetical protein
LDFLGYLEQGLMVRDIGKLRKRYIQSRAFLLDIISLLPTDFLYFIPKFYLLPSLRFNRLFRVYRFFEFSDKVETQTNHPNIFRLVSLLTIILIVIHWNACFYFIISRWIGYSSDSWVYDMTIPTGTTLTTQYLYCFFWSTLVLTNIGEVPPPESDVRRSVLNVDDSREYLMGFFSKDLFIRRLEEIRFWYMLYLYREKMMS